MGVLKAFFSQPQITAPHGAALWRSWPSPSPGPQQGPSCGMGRLLLNRMLQYVLGLHHWTQRKKNMHV